MNFYAYRFMIHVSEDNHILEYRRLFHHFAVDMHIIVEMERLTYIHQKELRSEQCIHLRDVMNVEGNGNNVGQLIILPATYVGSLRHIHKNAQDSMIYVHQYGGPDLFITFTCNPKGIEITNLLLPGQSSSDRHDITARVFEQKLKALMGLHCNISYLRRCTMLDVLCRVAEKRTAHAHILLWMVEKIR